MAERRHCRPRCDTCSSPCSARFSTWSERPCSTAAMRRSTSSCCLSGFDMEPATLVAAVLMTIGLFAKTALFPLHLWLPPAHAGAPAAASAVLSAVVVKGSFFLVVRLWFDVDARDARCRRRATVRCAGSGGNRVRQRRRTATEATQAPDRLFDGRADRLPVPDVSARLRHGVGAAPEQRRFDRRHASGDIARDGEGGHVHGRRTYLRSART